MECLYNNKNVAYLVPGNMILYSGELQMVLTKPTLGLGDYTSYWFFKVLSPKTLKIETKMVLLGSYFKVLC